jgi:hypothetical protein
MTRMVYQRVEQAFDDQALNKIWNGLVDNCSMICISCLKESFLSLTKKVLQPQELEDW